MFQPSQHYIPSRVIDRLHHKMMALQYHSEAFSRRLPKTRLLFADPTQMLLVSTGSSPNIGLLHSRDGALRHFEIPDHTAAPSWAIAGHDCVVLGSIRPQSSPYVYAKSFSSDREFSSVGRPYIVQSEDGILDVFAVEDERGDARLAAYRTLSLNLRDSSLESKPRFVPRIFADQVFWFQSSQKMSTFPSQLLFSRDFQELFFNHFYLDAVLRDMSSTDAKPNAPLCPFKQVNDVLDEFHQSGTVSLTAFNRAALAQHMHRTAPVQSLQQAFTEAVTELVAGLTESKHPTQVWDLLLERPEMIEHFRPVFGTKHIDRLVTKIQKPTSNRALL